VVLLVVGHNSIQNVLPPYSVDTALLPVAFE
jgi:hypothetical protein